MPGGSAARRSSGESSNMHTSTGTGRSRNSDVRPDLASMSATMMRFRELRERKWLRSGLECLAEHIRDAEFDWHHQDGGTLPRQHLWRPYRFCVQDVVLGLTVFRHSRSKNHLEVDVFLTAAIPEYEADSGARALMLLLLSEAYKAGGTMTIEFSPRVEDGTVPVDVVRLATAVGVALEHIDEGRIVPLEANQLFAALTGFSDQLRGLLAQWEARGEMSVASVCYAIHHGVWERPEVEAILLTSPRPGSLLGGQSQPELRHPYLVDLVFGRAALMYGSLDRHLRYRSHAKGDSVVLLEDDRRELEVSIDGGTYAVTFQSETEDMAVPWISYPKESGPAIIARGQPLTVLIRARKGSDLGRALPDDWRSAEQASRSGACFVLVPRDFDDLPSEVRDGLLRCRPPEIGLLVYPQTSTILDEEVARRLRTSGVLRT